MTRNETTTAQVVCHCPFCDFAMEMLLPFCQACGAKLVFCASCGEPLPKGSQVCPACGTARETEGANES